MTEKRCASEDEVLGCGIAIVSVLLVVVVITCLIVFFEVRGEDGVTEAREMEMLEERIREEYQAARTRRLAMREMERVKMLEEVWGMAEGRRRESNELDMAYAEDQRRWRREHEQMVGAMIGLALGLMFLGGMFYLIFFAE